MSPVTAAVLQAVTIPGSSPRPADSGLTSVLVASDKKRL